MQEIKKFLLYFKPYKRPLAVGVFCIFASMSFGLLIPSLVGMAVDDLYEEVTWDKVIFYPLAIICSNLVSGFFLFWQRRLIINTSRHVEYDMRNNYYSALVDQPLEYFYNTRVGDLMARATNDLAAVRQMAGPMVLYSCQAVFALAIIIPILLNISVKLTLLIMIPLPLVSLTVKFLGEQVHKRFEKIQEFFSDITARAQENLNGVRVIRAFARERSEIAKFEDLNKEFAGQNIKLVKFSAAMRPLLFFFIGLGFVIIVAVGIPMAVEGEITAGDFTAFILYLQRMVWYLIALGYVVNLYQRGTASLKRFNSVLETEPAIVDSAEAVQQPPIKGRIQFKDLSFSYDGKEILRHIDLTIESGMTAAFIGRTGSGKSTLMNLIPRLLDAPEDAILIDGRPIKQFPLKQLRKAIGFVPQETFLFSNSIRQNIMMGVGNTEDRKVSPEMAAEIAGLTDSIKHFPDKYEQMLGERGITLSGGQKQRTAIARAIARDPAILILDDSLSAVDTLTEETILKSLKEFRKDRTTLIISHRISTIRDADVIFWLEDGEIIEQGKHTELLALQGNYAALYKRQLLEEEINAVD